MSFGSHSAEDHLLFSVSLALHAENNMSSFKAIYYRVLQVMWKTNNIFFRPSSPAERSSYGKSYWNNAG